MLDPERIYIWAWDARPFPSFPMRLDEWADGESYFTGHWLNGRYGGATIGEIVAAMCADTGIQLDQVASSAFFIEGTTVAEPATLRREIEGLLASEDLYFTSGADGLTLGAISRNAPVVVDYAALKYDEQALIAKRPDAGENIRRLDLKYLDRLADYGGATAFFATDGQKGARAYLNWPTSLDSATAQKLAARQLQQGQTASVQYEFSLPLSLAEIEPGDVLQLSLGTRPAVVNMSTLDIGQKLSLDTLDAIEGGGGNISAMRQVRSLEPAQSAPLIVFAQTPADDANELSAQTLVAAYAKPWPGDIRLTNVDGRPITTITAPNPIGILQVDFPGASGTGFWDARQEIVVRMLSGHLSSQPRAAVLQGSNQIWVEKENGDWEKTGFVHAELIAPKTYRLTTLLRGLGKTQFAVSHTAQSGARVLLDGEATRVDLPSELVGAALEFYAYAGPSDPEAMLINWQIDADPMRPLAPVHLSAMRLNDTQDIAMNWVRASRLSGDMWQGTDVPLDAASLNFELRVGVGSAIYRTAQTTQPQFVYAAADQMADFGFYPTNFWVEVSQTSPIWGQGHSTRIEFSD